MDRIYFILKIHTQLGMLMFDKDGTTHVVLEGGIGAKLDHVNVVKPKVSVITSIGLDHIGILGFNEAEILTDKSHIIKFNTPVIIGPGIQGNSEFEKIINDRATLTNSKVVFLKVRSVGIYDYAETNRRIAFAALKEIYPHISYALIEDILPPPGRFQTIFISSPVFPHVIIYDVGHNPQGIEFFINRYNECYQIYFVMVLGMQKTKDHKACCEFLAKQDNLKKVFLVEIENTAPLQEMQSILTKAGKEVSILTGNETQLSQLTSSYLNLLVGGSFLTVAKISKQLNRNLLELNSVKAKGLEALARFGIMPSRPSVEQRGVQSSEDAESRPLAALD